MLKILEIKGLTARVLDTVDNVEETISTKRLKLIASIVDFDDSILINQRLAKSKLLGMYIKSETIDDKIFNVMYGCDCKTSTLEIPKGVNLIEHTLWDDVRRNNIRNIKIPASLLYL